MKAEINFNLKKATSTLESINYKASNLQKAVEGITDIVREDVKQRFISSPNTETGGVVYGGKYWNPLSKSYLASHPERLGGQIYIDSGNLKDSFTIEGHADNVSDFNGTTIEIGSKVPYANKLQSMRPIIFWHLILEQQVAEYLLKWVSEND